MLVLSKRFLSEHELKRQVCDISSVLWDRGWVANHDGNVSAKAAPGRIVATPTSFTKRRMKNEDLIVIDESKRVVGGRNRIFSEVALHLLVYGLRDDVRAVVHAHCPFATARGLAATSMPCFLPESVVSLGAEVPVVPLTMPGKDAVDALGPFVLEHDVVMIAGNGVLAWGVDPEQALLRMELAEHLCRIGHTLVSGQGCIPTLPQDMVEALLKKRTSAGLGPEGRRSRKQ